MKSWDRIVKKVFQRAENRCEYCLMHQALQGATFHVEHIVPKSRGGRTKLANLAPACPACNLAKSDRIEASDPETGIAATLFNPRTQAWRDHFRWEDYLIIGTTPIGRATVYALDLNHSRRLLIRHAEERLDLFERG